MVYGIDLFLSSNIHFLFFDSSPTDTLAYFHSNKVFTVGDLARLTASQIENSPLPSPKLSNIQKALQDFSNNNISLIPLATTSEETPRKSFM